MKSKNKHNWIIATVALILIGAAAGGYYWKTEQDRLAAEAEPELQTTKVRVGDIVLSASGPGTVVPANQADLGFRTNGVINNILVVQGQSVASGDTLATLNNDLQHSKYLQAQAEFEGLFSAEGIAKAKITLANAQIAEADAIEELQYLISPEVFLREVDLENAQNTTKALDADPNATEAAKTEAQNSVIKAQTALDNALYRYKADYIPGIFEVTYTDEETLEEITTIIAPTDSEIALARASLESARFSVIDAQSYLAILESGIEAVTGPIPTIPGTETAKIEQARINYENAKLDYENTALLAPFAGEILSLDATVGQTVNTNPIITLADTSVLSIHFYLDESDLDKATVGNRILVTFAAYPDTAFEGKITSVDRVLENIEGTPAVSVWAEVQTSSTQVILSGMTVDVEVIGGESLGTKLLPAQAVREIAEDSFAVFVVAADGSLKLTPVEVGLRDFANVEILSGVEVGDVVSTGTVETK